MITVKSKLAGAALTAVFACALCATASAAPMSSLNSGSTAPGGALPALDGGMHAGGAVFGPDPMTGAPTASTPVPQPYLIPPPLELVPQPLPQHGPQPAAADLPEPRSLTLLLAGLALLGLGARRRQRH